MPTDFYQQIVERCAREMPWILNTCLSGFGEFATDAGWREKLAIAASLFERVHVVSNLSLLDTGDLDLLLRLATDIRVSLYAMSEPIYQAVHRPPAGLACAALQAKIRYLSDRRAPGHRLVLNWLELPENRHETAAWMAAWKDRVDLLEAWRPHNWIDARGYRQMCAHRVPSCGRPRTGPVQVQVDGTVNVCCFDYNGELVIGDLRRQGFREIFEGPEMVRIQRLHVDDAADELPTCKICDQRNCADCKSREVIFNSRYTPEQRVSMTSTVYEDLLRKKGER
jgi:hypothetical protein